MTSLDGYCAACEQPMGPNRHMEHLATPTGRCFVRTCATHACISRAQIMRQGKPVDPGPDDAEKARRKLKQTPAARSGRTKATGNPDPNERGLWEWPSGVFPR